MTLHPGFRSFFFVLSAMLIVACGTTSSSVSYYSLSSLFSEPAAPLPETTLPAIGLTPVVLPDYLDRPQIVTRTAPNQMHIDEYHRWAGQLKDELSRVLTENLMVLTGSRTIDRAPWAPGFTPELILSVELTTFEAFADGKVRLIGVVAIADQRSAAKPVTWNVRLEEQAVGREYADLAAAQSRLLATLSRQISAAIARRP
jgi:uncharacterized protein